MKEFKAMLDRSMLDRSITEDDKLKARIKEADKHITNLLCHQDPCLGEEARKEINEAWKYKEKYNVS